jgi:hypothetical protein
MSELRYTLVSDGSSDRMLMPILDWVLQQHSDKVFMGSWADLRQLRRPTEGLAERVRIAMDLYPCDLLFVHRDAERSDRAIRVREIERELDNIPHPPWIGVVPIRMQEAWFLFDAGVIREAGGNPSGGMRLELPALRRAEAVPNPKKLLEDLLKKASGRRGRRLEQLRVGPMKYRVAELIRDYSSLRALSAFEAFETDVRRMIVQRRWA